MTSASMAEKKKSHSGRNDIGRVEQETSSSKKMRIKGKKTDAHTHTGQGKTAADGLIHVLSFVKRSTKNSLYALFTTFCLQ